MKLNQYCRRNKSQNSHQSIPLRVENKSISFLTPRLLKIFDYTNWLSKLFTFFWCSHGIKWLVGNWNFLLSTRLRIVGSSMHEITKLLHRSILSVLRFCYDIFEILQKIYDSSLFRVQKWIQSLIFSNLNFIGESWFMSKLFA